MAQLVAVGSLRVLRSVAAIMWRNRSPSPLPGKGRNRSPSFHSVGDVLRAVGGQSLPVDRFEDWKLHYLRIAVSALPPRRPWGSGLGHYGGIRSCANRQPRGLEHADER